MTNNRFHDLYADHVLALPGRTLATGAVAITIFRLFPAMRFHPPRAISPSGEAARPKSTTSSAGPSRHRYSRLPSVN